MSLPYPQDRARARQEGGEQPYKDAKEAMSEKEARLQAEAEQYGETHLGESDEERAERFENEMEERLGEVGAEADRDERRGRGDQSRSG